MGHNPHELYELIEELPAGTRPVLVQTLIGFVDAGNAVHLAQQHLLSSFDATLIARFDLDPLYDYRSRRPVLTFVEDHWDSYDEPVLGVYLVRDDGGTPFLVLAGPEPDLAWERFIDSVAHLIDRLDVRLTVGLTGIPMAVPHTRPVGVTAHGTRAELIMGHERWLSRAQVPATIGNLLEYRLGQRGKDALGFAVHVPHYLAQSSFPAAAEELLSQVSRATGLLIPTERLHTAADVVRGEIDRQIADAEDARALVSRLEQQYDAFAGGRHRGNLLADQERALPSADELAAELERFLAEHRTRDDQPET